MTQRATVHPFHDHIDAAAFFVIEYPHHTRMIELFANLLLPLEAIEEERITFHLGMWHFDHYIPAALQVSGAIDRRHAALRDEDLNAVMVELVARLKRIHWTCAE